MILPARVSLPRGNPPSAPENYVVPPAHAIHLFKLAEAFAEVGFHPVLPAPRHLMRALQSAVQLVSLRKKLEIDATGPTQRHAFDLWCASYARRRGAELVVTRSPITALASALLRQPVVLDLHQPPTRSGHLAMQMLLRAPSKTQWAVSAISGQLATHLKKLYPTLGERGKLAIIRDAADLRMFSKPMPKAVARARLGIDPNAKTVGWVGRPYPGKGLQQVFALAEELPELLFLAAVAGLSNTPQCPPNLRIFKELPFHQVPILLAASDVLILPNQPHAEGAGGADIGLWTSPLRLFEYLASARPVVASDIPPIREIVEPHGGAILVHYSDLSSWKRAILDLLSNPLLAEELSQKGAEIAAHHSWKARAKALAELVS